MGGARARTESCSTSPGHSYAHRLVKILALDSLVVKEETLRRSSTTTW